MYQSFTPAFRQFIFLLLCVLPLSSQAASTKETPLDLSIIKQSDALRRYMTSQQGVAYVQASQLIKEGESDIRSGESLQQQKATTMYPNKDLKPIHERGERLVEEGQAKVIEGQKQLVATLTAVQTKRTANQAVAAKKYNFKLSELEYATALEVAATQTLETCRDAGYKKVFFDGLRIITAALNTKAAPKAHNAAYDTFIKADGTQFSLTVPLGLKLEKDETTAEYTFHYDNSSAFEGEKIALLAIELIAPGNGPEALLSVRTLDLDSQQLISSALFYIADASDVLNPHAMVASTTEAAEPTNAETTLEATSEEPIPAAELTAVPRTIPESVTINEQNQILDKIAGLASPYFFETAITADNSAQSILLDSLLKDTLLKNSSLLFVESNFIQRAYLPAGVAPETLSSAATAAFVVTQSEGNYSIAAEAYGSGRVLEVGTMTLSVPE